MSLIFRDSPNPFYVVSPPYTRTSAGVRALHLLCHALNISGETAFMIVDPGSAARLAEYRSGPDLLTPYLDQATADDHFHRGKIPLVVYPEIVAGNPYQAPCVIRYVLNYPGLLGGDRTYHPDELRYGYSEKLAAAAGADGNVMFVPVCDTRIFRMPDIDRPRKGTCFYADRYVKDHGGVVGDLPQDSVQIVRQQAGEQTPEEIASIFQSSELFFLFENTSLAIEAVLCGCPAVFLPNPYLTDVISSAEVGHDGYAWGASPDEVVRAKNSVRKGADNYLRSCDAFWSRLGEFVADARRHAGGRTYDRPIRVPAKARVSLAEGHSVFPLLSVGTAGALAGSVASSVLGAAGNVLFGPYVRLPAGAYDLVIDARSRAEDGGTCPSASLSYDVSCKDVLLSSGVIDLTSDWQANTVPFQVRPDHETLLKDGGFEFRIWTDGRSSFDVSDIRVQAQTLPDRDLEMSAMVSVGSAGTREAGLISSGADSTGNVFHGPYMALLPGRYRVDVELAARGPWGRAVDVVVDVVAGDRELARADRSVAGTRGVLDLEFVVRDLPQLEDVLANVEVRLDKRTRGDLRISSVRCRRLQASPSPA